MIGKVKPGICECGKPFDRRNRKSCSEECAKLRRNKLSRIKTKQMKAIAKEIGNCTYCYKERDNPKYNLCSKCRMNNRIYQTKWKEGLNKK
jgi:hypothetical protein